MRCLWIALVSMASAGCPAIAPGSKPYSPSDAFERQLFLQARRDVFPDDVRSNPGQYASTTLLWSAVISEVQEEQGDAGPQMVVFQHHYWDFIEDYSVQKAIAFLSPRGEGRFIGSVPTEERQLTVGDMAVVYVTPLGVDADGTVGVVVCGLKTLRRELYATDVWDYGRAYLLSNDRTDFKVLRTPLW